MRRLLLLLCSLWIALPAGAAFTIDPARSTLTPSSGPAETLSGTLSASLGAPLPLASNTSFDLTSLGATSSGGLSITLDPTLANPGAGVLSPSGSFLIPNLFLEVGDGSSIFQLTVPDVLGSFGALPGCPAALCLETRFDIDTGGPAGIVSVSFFAVPEPASAALLLLGCAGLAALRRRHTR